MSVCKDSICIVILDYCHIYFTLDDIKAAVYFDFGANLVNKQIVCMYESDRLRRFR